MPKFDVDRKTARVIRPSRRSTVFLAALPLFIASFSARAATSCEDLAKISLPSTSIRTAQLIPAGSFVPPPTAREPGIKQARFDDLPAFCRISATMTPVPGSRIEMEVWMPATSAWNGNFRGTWGPTHIAGDAAGPGLIGLAAALRQGFAAAGTDLGHQGTDARYAMDHPEGVVDFGERAVHEMTVKAKALIAAYYDRSPAYSYMVECGTGAIGTLSEAQRYPTDYDGIVSGGGGEHPTRHGFAQMWMWQISRAPGANIPSDKLQILNAAAVNACDAADGIKDGIIANPPSCRFDPAVLQCGGSATSQCLTPAQVEFARQMYAGPKNPRTHEQIYSGVYPGSELGWSAMTGAAPIGFAPEYFKYYLDKNPNWDPVTDGGKIDYDRDVTRADGELAVLNAIDPNVKPFIERGGKLLMSKHWNDVGLPPGELPDYYKKMVATIGEKAAAESVRLFMLPGQNSCSNSGDNFRFDLLTAIRGWVEHGAKPDGLTATQLANGKTVRTRPLCAYPAVATYSGKGDVNDAASFICRAP